MTVDAAQTTPRDSHNMASAAAAHPAQVAMLVKGDEVYGIGSVEKRYAEAWPDTTFVCLGPGAMYDWLHERRASVFLVEGLIWMHEKKSLNTIAGLPLVMRRAKRDARRIHERLAGKGIRIIHAHWRPQQYIAGYMRRLGYRSVWQIHNTTSRTRLGGLGMKLNHRMARWGADLLLPVSDYIADNWRASGVPIRTIRNCAVPIFTGANELPLEGPLRTLVAGRLEASKGHHVAVAAVAAARRAGCDITLDVFGGPLENNPYADELRRQIAAAGIESAVRLMGFCTDLRTRHQQYHVGLQCRIDPEPCSVWVCETLVDGLPLIASANGGTPELVVEGVTGYLSQPGSADELAKRLIALWNDRALLSRMRQAAFARGQSQFTVQRFLDETAVAYDCLASSG
jgi:glycosyltransferase involved in cell wall biosynthesis